MVCDAQLASKFLFTFTFSAGDSDL